MVVIVEVFGKERTAWKVDAPPVDLSCFEQRIIFLESKLNSVTIEKGVTVDMSHLLLCCDY